MRLRANFAASHATGAASARSSRCGLHAALVVVWLWTGVVSLIELRGQSTALLVQAGVSSLPWQSLLIVSGALADLALGLWLWLKPGRTSYAAALGLMLLMTLIATAMQPALWLHPLGPLLKNIPIAAVLWHLLDSNNPTDHTTSANEALP